MVRLSQNYFELFGLPAAFIVDIRELSQRYRELQAVVHPDRFASASPQEQRLSLQQASLVNEAYQTLRDPVRRAQYLLAEKGIDMRPDQETTKDTAFLMEQLMLREELENARRADNPVAVLNELMDRVSKMIKTLVAQMAIQFEEGTPDQLEAARESVRKMQFLNKLHSEAEVLKAELEDSY